MKRFDFIVALMAMLTLTNCGTMVYDDERTEENDYSANTSTRLVTFSADTVAQGEMSSVTKASSTSTVVKERCTYLQYWIYDEDYSNLMASGVQTSEGTTNFGSFSATLTDGTYHVIVVGHNQTSAMTLNEKDFMLSLASEDERNGDTYYANKECTITKGTNNFSLTLNRNMCVVVVANNVKATNIGAVDIEMTYYGTSFSVKDGFASGTTTKTYSFTITEDDRKKSSLKFGIYFPLPSSEECSGVSMTITPKNTDNEALTPTTISEIPAKAGRYITYTGALWGEDGTFSVSVSDTDWEYKNYTY